MRPYSYEKIGVVGGDEKTDAFLAHVKKTGAPISVVCTLDDWNKRGRGDIPMVHSIDEFRDRIAQEDVQTVILSPRIFSQDSFIERVCSVIPFSVHFLDLCGAYERFFHKIPLEAVDHTWFLRNISKPQNVWRDRVKRLLDVGIGVMGMGMMATMLPFIFLVMIMEDGGPVFYRQLRRGLGGKVFTLYKFRTMTHHNSKSEALWTEKHDPRTTRLGRILRRLHLDEVPQAINILKGDMSFVGPRAERVELADLFSKEIPFYFMRHLVRPGVTGWAQLQIPASASVEEGREKLQYDLYYVKNQSLFLDLEIIFKTISIVFFRRGT